MATSHDAIRAMLEAFARAWAAKDIDAVMACMSRDCVYGASIGPEPGRTFRGQEQVRAGVVEMLTHDAAIRSSTSNLVIADNRAFWEWRYIVPDGEGRHQELHGCDLFEFDGDKIALKQAFRKVYSE